METGILAAKYNCIVIYLEQKLLRERSHFSYDEKKLETKTIDFVKK